MGAQMTLRRAPDGWHYGIEPDGDELDTVAGTLEASPADPTGSVAEVGALIAAHHVTKVDIREDVPCTITEAIAASISPRKLRSTVRATPPPEA